MMPDSKNNWQWCPGATETEAQRHYVPSDHAYSLILQAMNERRRGASQLMEAMDHPSTGWQVTGGIHTAVGDYLHFNICVVVYKPNSDGAKVKKFRGQWHCYVHPDASGYWSVTSCTHSE